MQAAPDVGIWDFLPTEEANLNFPSYCFSLISTPHLVSPVVTILHGSDTLQTLSLRFMLYDFDRLCERNRFNHFHL